MHEREREGEREGDKERFEKVRERERERETERERRAVARTLGGLDCRPASARDPRRSRGRGVRVRAGCGALLGRGTRRPGPAGHSHHSHLCAAARAGRTQAPGPCTRLRTVAARAQPVCCTQPPGGPGAAQPRRFAAACTGWPPMYGRAASRARAGRARTCGLQRGQRPQAATQRRPGPARSGSGHASRDQSD